MNDHYESEEDLDAMNELLKSEIDKKTNELLEFHYNQKDQKVYKINIYKALCNYKNKQNKFTTKVLNAKVSIIHIKYKPKLVVAIIDHNKQNVITKFELKDLYLE